MATGSRRLAEPASLNSVASLASLGSTDAEALLLAASDVVSEHCNVATSDAPRTFARETLQETVILAKPANKLLLSRFPTDLTSLTIDGDAVTLSDTFEEEAGVLSFVPGAEFERWPAAVLIVATYDAGYVTDYQAAQSPAPSGPPMPESLERAVILTAQHLYAMQQREQFDVAAEVEEDSDAGRLETRYFNAGRSPGVPGSAQALLAPYRRLV